MFARARTQPLTRLLCFQVNLMNCPKITGAGVQWLATGCPLLSSLNVKGTEATLTTLNIVKERYPNVRIKASLL